MWSLIGWFSINILVFEIMVHGCLYYMGIIPCFIGVSIIITWVSFSIAWCLSVGWAGIIWLPRTELTTNRVVPPYLVHNSTLLPSPTSYLVGVFLILVLYTHTQSICVSLYVRML